MRLSTIGIVVLIVAETTLIALLLTMDAVERHDKEQNILECKKVTQKAVELLDDAMFGAYPTLVWQPLRASLQMQKDRHDLDIFLLHCFVKDEELPCIRELPSFKKTLDATIETLISPSACESGNYYRLIDLGKQIASSLQLCDRSKQIQAECHEFFARTSFCGTTPFVVGPASMKTTVAAVNERIEKEVLELFAEIEESRRGNEGD